MLLVEVANVCQFLQQLGEDAASGRAWENGLQVALQQDRVSNTTPTTSTAN